MGFLPSGGHSLETSRWAICGNCVFFRYSIMGEDE